MKQGENGDWIDAQGNMNRPASIKGPFRIVSLDIGSGTILSGWLEKDGRYAKYNTADETMVSLRYDRMQYRNLDHFAGVLGKFDPTAAVLAEPIEIAELNHASLDKIKHHYPQIAYEI